MKRIIYILLALSAALNARFAKGQSCPEKPTYTNESGTYDLSSGVSIVLNNGKTFQITVQNNFSSTSSICVLNGSTLYLSFQNVNNMSKGGFINVDKNATLSIGGNGINGFPLTIINGGTTMQATNITYGDGATITNSGTYNISSDATLNSGTVSFTNSGIFNATASLNYNSGTFAFTNSGTATFNNALRLSSTTFINSGNLTCKSEVTLQGSSSVRNTGYIYLQNNANLTLNDAVVTNSAVLSIAGSTTINSGSVLNNSCTVKEYADFSNNGTVSNTGSVLLTVNGSSNFLNQGTFTNGITGFVQGSNFTNNSSITGGGNFYFSGNTINQGPFTGGDKGINFYDASNSTSQYFDIQNTTPTNATKNQISSNNSTTFTSCSDTKAPVITAQPQTQILCNPSATEAKFSVTATSNTTPAYQWYKNEKPVPGATSSVFSLSNLTLADTANFYNVVVTNTAGSIWSNSVYVKYVIVSSPSAEYLATGNMVSFSIKTSGGVKGLQWQKGGVSISGANATTYGIPVVNYADSGKYTLFLHYDGGTCTSDAAVLKTSIVLYSKSTGNLNLPATWGVNTDGTGSSPVDFTREEHIFKVYNRTSAETGSDLTIAGTLDISNSKVTITPNTTLDAGRIIRALSVKTAALGAIAVSATANLTVHGIATAAYAGASDLYFDKDNNTIKNLVTSAHTVTLRTALNIASGKNYGTLQVNSGTFITSDSLILKSDSLGTAGVAKSAGAIKGKVTIERFIHARRAWRFIGAPVSDVNAPTINAAWQEGATGSTSNPHSGYGTHITGGTEANGFDKSPTNNSSLKFLSNTGAWTPVTNTNKTDITQYPAYMFFIRGDRSYGILSTTAKTTPTTTVIRVTGNLYQGTLAAKTVSANGYTVVMNPYASPVNFAKMMSAGSNIKNRIRVWDPTLAGEKGVGAWVIVDGTTGTYKTTPPSKYVSTVLQAGQGFIIESADGKNNGSFSFSEEAKDFSASTTSDDREAGNTTDTSLEVNLKLFNADNTASIADGILYNFGARNNDSADANDAYKMYNTGENITITDGGHWFSINSRTAPKEGDSLKLNVTGIKAASYQLEFVPSLLKNKSLALYDKYLNTFSPVSATDTTRITFSILSSVAASKAADRFTIVAQKSALPSMPTVSASLIYTKVRTYTTEAAINVEWKVENESAVLYYQVQKSADGISFTTTGSVLASGKGTYTYTDAAPASGINYYRIKSISKSGDSKYAPIVSGQPETTASAKMSIYPNPLTGATFTATLTSLPAAAYTLTVVNSNGVIMFSKSITHNGGTASQKVTLTNSLPAGIYHINLVSATGTVSSVPVAAN